MPRNFITLHFQRASELPDAEKFLFLKELNDHSFYRPREIIAVFADLTKFCLSVSNLELEEFASRLRRNPRLVAAWANAETWPHFAIRDASAAEMIATAQAARGCIKGELPCLDGSNVISIFSARPK